MIERKVIKSYTLSKRAIKALNLVAKKNKLSASQALNNLLIAIASQHND